MTRLSVSQLLFTNDSVSHAVYFDDINSAGLFVKADCFFICIQIVHIQNGSPVYVEYLDRMNGFF